jgi:hypothetical protein
MSIQCHNPCYRCTYYPFQTHSICLEGQKKIIPKWTDGTVAEIIY